MFSAFRVLTVTPPPPTSLEQHRRRLAGAGSGHHGECGLKDQACPSEVMPVLRFPYACESPIGEFSILRMCLTIGSFS